MEKVLSSKGFIEPKEYITVKENLAYKVNLGILGSVIATADHLWPVVGNYLMTTHEIYNNLNGKATLDIPFLNKKYKITSIEKINFENEKEFYCYKIDTDDKLFYIKTKKNKIQKALSNCIYKGDLEYIKQHFDANIDEIGLFVHNCQGRLACGRINGTASMMLFGSTVGTTINGAVPGEGMMAANGVMYNVHYYFTETDFLFNWFKKCGFNNKGYTAVGAYKETNGDIKTNNDDNEDVKEEVSAEELDDIFDFNPQLVEFKIDDELKKEINRAKNQEFQN